MNSEMLDTSGQWLPGYTDWQRYETPTVLRRHGREYLERFWRDGNPRPTRGLRPVMEHLATLQGGEIVHSGEPLSLRVELHLTRGARS